MKFKVGDVVSFIDEVGEATVLKVHSGEVLLLQDDILESWVSTNDIIAKKSLVVNSTENKEEDFKPKQRTLPKKERGTMEKDLHIHQLVEFSGQMTNYEMLQIQIDAARKALSKARRAKAKKLILIHGVGAGKLREELHQLLRHTDNISFYDASFNRYGAGATEIDLW